MGEKDSDGDVEEEEEDDNHKQISLGSGGVEKISVRGQGSAKEEVSVIPARAIT